MNWTPEFSRRARGFATYAAIRELGVQGIEELIDRTCLHAKAIINGIEEIGNVEVVAEPVINQGLIRFLDPHGKSEVSNDTFTENVISEINQTGEAFFQPTTFKGKRCMRVSVSSWRTNDEDVSRTIAAVRKVLTRISEPVLPTPSPSG
jgi:aromatic-L-amino-acid decarboxylase